MVHKPIEPKSTQGTVSHLQLLSFVCNLVTSNILAVGVNKFRSRVGTSLRNSRGFSSTHKDCTFLLNVLIPNLNIHTEDSLPCLSCLIDNNVMLCKVLLLYCWQIKAILTNMNNCQSLKAPYSDIKRPYALADPGGTPPQTGSNYFVFTYIFAEKRLHRRSVAPQRVDAPNRKSWIRHW